MSGSDFYNALVVPLLYIDAEGVLGSSGFVAESQFTPFGLSGAYKTWKLDSAGYRNVLNNSGRGGFWDWQRFKAITAGSWRAASDISKRYGWSPGQQNAFQHAAWQAQLTAAFGRDIAKEIGDLHEEGETGVDTAADSYNNEIARQMMELCLEAGESMDDCINRMLEMIHNDDGTFITEADDPRIQQIIDGDLVIEDIEVVLN